MNVKKGTREAGGFTDQDITEKIRKALASGELLDEAAEALSHLVCMGMCDFPRTAALVDDLLCPYCKRPHTLACCGAVGSSKFRELGAEEWNCRLVDGTLHAR